LTQFGVTVLRLALPKVQAWERVNDPEMVGRMSMGQLFETMLEAGYSRDVAEDAASEHGWRRLESGATL
jgi:hypothetical protein